MAADLVSFISSLREIMKSGGGKADICSIVGNGFDVKESNGVFIVSPQFLKRDFSREISFDLNGVVFDGAGKILALPIPSYNPAPLNQAAIDKFDKYRVQRVKDGTTITLYYNGSWKIATSGGIDMGGVIFMGKKTYAECLSDLCPNIYEKLSPQFSYTLGFHHEEYHPIARGVSEAWIYAACDLSALNAEIPTVNFSIPEIGLEPPESVLMTYSEVLADNSSALRDYLNGGAPRFGYILRGEFADFGAYTACMLPSALMKYLTKSFYNLPQSHRIRVSPDTRRKTTCILAYFDNRVGPNFWNIFPQFQPTREMITGVIRESVNQAIIAAGNKSRMQDLQRQKRNQSRQAATGTLARSALATAGKGGLFNPHEPSAREILRDCILRLGKSELVEILLPIE